MTQFRRMSRKRRERRKKITTRDDTHLLYSAQIKKYSPFRRLRWPFWHDKLFAFVSNKQQDLYSCKSIQLFLPSKCIFSIYFSSSLQRNAHRNVSARVYLHCDVFFCVTIRHCCAVLHRALSDCQVGCQSEKRNKRSNNNKWKELELIPLSSYIIVYLTPSTVRFALIRTVWTAIGSHQVRKRNNQMYYIAIAFSCEMRASNLNSVRRLISGQCVTWEYTQ